MRVLWFTNTASLSADYLNDKSIGGGWIVSLEAKLSRIPSIELGISFNVDQKIKPFTLNKTQYYPVHIQSPKGKIKQVISRWTKRIQDENNIQPYLDIIHEFKPDVIQIFGTEGVFGLIISKINIPCIIHIQGNLILCDYKWHSGITATEVLRYSKKWRLIKGFGLYHDYLVNKKATNRERSIFLQCKYFMGRTDWDRRITSVLSPKSKYFHCDEMLRHGFYSNNWLPKEKQTDFTLLTIIRNNPYKGLETIFESKRILNEINVGKEIFWKIAGINKEDEISYLIEKKFRSTFKQLGIQLLGALNEKELVSEMLNADLFIHPSHIENGSNSTSEAMLMGMPIIATFAGGIPTTIENKKEGLLVQDGDPYALAGAILELKQNRNLAIELGNNARATAVKRHDPERITNELLHIYSSIINCN